MNRLVVIVMGTVATVFMAVSLFLRGEDEASIQRLAMSCLLFGILVCLYKMAF